MKKLFGTSALVMALTMPAFAQDANTTLSTDPALGMASPYLEGIDRGVRASDFIGKRVYVTEQDTSTLSVDAIAAADAGWENAGEISDLIISLNGDSEAVLVDFGGFLGIGEKTVAVSMSSLVMVPDSSSPDDYFIVFHGSKAQLEGAPEFNADMVFDANTSNMGQADSTGQAANTGMTDSTGAAGSTSTGGTSDNTMGNQPAGNQSATGQSDSTNMGNDTTVDLTMMAEADLIGRRVVGPNNEDIGEISGVAVGTDGTISGAVVDVGGFLGIGEKRVSLGSEALTIVRNAGGTVDHFRVTMTQDQLETLPTYEN